MKQPYHDIALAAGGSHYPTVGGRLLEQFGQLVVERCMALADTETAERIAQEFGLSKGSQNEQAQT
jgi:hypothetical protein